MYSCILPKTGVKFGSFAISTFFCGLSECINTFISPTHLISDAAILLESLITYTGKENREYIKSARYSTRDSELTDSTKRNTTFPATPVSLKARYFCTCCILICLACIVASFKLSCV